MYGWLRYVNVWYIKVRYMYWCIHVYIHACIASTQLQLPGFLSKGFPTSSTQVLWLWISGENSSEHGASFQEEPSVAVIRVLLLIWQEMDGISNIRFLDHSVLPFCQNRVIHLFLTPHTSRWNGRFLLNMATSSWNNLEMDSMQLNRNWLGF